MSKGYVKRTASGDTTHVQMRDRETGEDFRDYCQAVNMNMSDAATMMVRYYLDNVVTKYDFMSREDLIAELKKMEGN